MSEESIDNPEETPEESNDSPEEMSGESTDNPEEQKRRVRRKLLKLGVYSSIAVITSFVASKSAYACGPVHQVCPPKAGPGGSS
jgi:hypothetical protein